MAAYGFSVHKEGAPDTTTIYYPLHPDHPDYDLFLKCTLVYLDKLGQSRYPDVQDPFRERKDNPKITEYYVKDILAYGEGLVLVRWWGYPETAATWEKVERMTECEVIWAVWEDVDREPVTDNRKGVLCKLVGKNLGIKVTETSRCRYFILLLWLYWLRHSLTRYPNPPSP